MPSSFCQHAFFFCLDNACHHNVNDVKFILDDSPLALSVLTLICVLFFLFRIFLFVCYCFVLRIGSGVLGGWWFGGSPSSPDSNFLRVANAFPNRRLSDNTLMTPKIRIAPSCASSPGGTPGGGLPIRRHSSIGPQERRGSAMNLSPPTVSILCSFQNFLYFFVRILGLVFFFCREEKFVPPNNTWNQNQRSYQHWIYFNLWKFKKFSKSSPLFHFRKVPFLH